MDALVEEGIFTNALSGDYTINGKKLWGNLPSGYSDADLPAVTFEVYDADALQANPDAKAVATLAISEEQWPQLKDGSSYNWNGFWRSCFSSGSHGLRALCRNQRL